MFFVVVCGGPVAWLLAPSMVEGPGEPGPSLSDVLFFAGLVGAPCLLYALVIRRRIPVIVFGSALAALELWSIWAAETGESSTSALALLSIPLAGIPLVLLGWLMQTWSRPDP